MSVKIIYYVHGTTTYNELHKAAGWNDVNLSDKGVQQSKELRNCVKIDEIDFVISSDLKRAVDSAKNIFNDDKKIVFDNRIRECNYGELNGADSSQIIYENHIDTKFSGGESLKDVEERVRSLCYELLQKYDGKTIAFVAHRAPQLALEVIVNKMSWEEAISNDWRKMKAWKPGWEYQVNVDMLKTEK